MIACEITCIVRIFSKTFNTLVLLEIRIILMYIVL